MKVAIVGTSIDLTDIEKESMIEKISEKLQNLLHDKANITIISGGAKGVDNLAIQIAKGLNFKTESYDPKKQNWKYFKQRNNLIAKDCDVLYCFTIPNKTRKSKCYHHGAVKQEHEKTAGCWTMDKALLLGRKCELIIVK